MEGIYGVWKPKGPTSYKIISQIRKLTGIRRVGHAGTLDPLAEGVLVVAVGREYTKKIEKHKEDEKEYFATIKLGANSTTDDEEGEKEILKVSQIPKLEEVQKATKDFIGEIQQAAPKYSAVKIWGKEAYKRARKGEDFPLPPRNVEVKSIEVLKYKWPIVELKVTTGPGVYIRSLARDLGEKLKTGGYLAGLVRTRVGEYNSENSVRVEDFPLKSGNKRDKGS